MMKSALDDAMQAINFIGSDGRLVLYGFSITNNENLLAHQDGTSYFPMQIVESALTTANHIETECGKIITRESGLLTFDLPAFFRAAFIVAALQHNAGNASLYNKIRLVYGSNQSKDIAYVAQTSSDMRKQTVLVGHYIGLAPQTENAATNKFVIDTYGTQQYYGASVLIGVLL